MNGLKQLPAGGIAVIALIGVLFLLAVGLLFWVCGRYRRLSAMVNGEREQDSEFLRSLLNDYAADYKQRGQDVNTPALISDCISARLGRLLFCERFLNNAVSLFVTLGLFGTFLGLSHSVNSLTELISYSSTSEWLSVLDSVGGGLMSALSGMGVAFYTSLVGVACSILLTLLRSVFSPAAERERLETALELWLDETVAPGLPTAAPKDDAGLVRQMIAGLNAAAASMEKTLQRATAELGGVVEAGKAPLNAFQKTVGDFNEGVRDFSEFNYNLRGTVERMDVSVRDVVSGLREVSRELERSRK